MAEAILTSKSLLSFWPVGSIYMSMVDTNPSTYFGGTWVRIEDRFLLAATDPNASTVKYAVGSLGGEESHTLTIGEIPSHSHTIKGTNVGTNGGDYNSMHSDGDYSSGYTTTSAGGGGAHNNMPPYMAVYMWKRTA